MHMFLFLRQISYTASPIYESYTFIIYLLYPKIMAPSVRVTFKLCLPTSGYLLTFLDAMPPIFFFVLPLLDVVSSGSCPYACLPYVSSCNQFTIEFLLIYRILCGFGDLSYYYCLTAALSMAILLGPIWASHPMSNSTDLSLKTNSEDCDEYVPVTRTWLTPSLQTFESSQAWCCLSLTAPEIATREIFYGTSWTGLFPVARVVLELHFFMTFTWIEILIRLLLPS